MTSTSFRGRGKNGENSDHKFYSKKSSEMGKRRVKKPGKASFLIYGRPLFICHKLASPFSIQFRRIKTCAGVVCMSYVYNAPCIVHCSGPHRPSLKCVASQTPDSMCKNSKTSFLLLPYNS